MMCLSMCICATLRRDLQGFIEVLEPWMLPASLGPVASVLNSERPLDAFGFLTPTLSENLGDDVTWEKPCHFAYAVSKLKNDEQFLHQILQRSGCGFDL